MTLDLIGPLPESAGYDGILVIVSYFSKMAYYMPINMNICYESPREERVSHTFKHLISNIKLYNRVKI